MGEEFSYDQAQGQELSRQLSLGRRLTIANKRKTVAPAKGLAYEESYRCPACGSGELNAIAMMDVFACNFCRHMFTANLQTQSVQIADSLQPMAWQWNGWQWRTAQQNSTTAALVWSFASVLTVVPVAIIAISNYIFPPLEGSNFPMMWTGLTLTSHGIMSGWLLAEYHRWPWYIASRIRLQRLGERLFASE